MAILDIARPYQRKFIQDKRRFKIACWSRQVGKSWSLAAILVMKSLMHGAQGLSICLSINLRSASEILKKCVQMAEAVKALSKGAITYAASFDKIVFSNGARVMSLPGTMEGAAVRGWTVNGALVIDEAAYIRGLKELMQALAPTLTTCRNAELVLASTPSGKNHYFYKMWQDALEDPGWLASTVTIEDAVAQGLNVSIESLHKLCPDKQEFDVEYMCQFASEYSSLIDLGLLEYVDDVPECASYWLGMDIGSKHDRTTIVAVGQKDGVYYLTDLVVLDKAEYTRQLEVLRHVYGKHEFRAGYIDACGIGSPIGEFANKQISAKIVGFTTTGTNKPQMYERFRSLVFDRKFKIDRKFKQLVDQDVANVERIVAEDGKVRYEASRNASGHSDICSALVLALHASRQNPASLGAPVCRPFNSAFGQRASMFG